RQIRSRAQRDVLVPAVVLALSAVTSFNAPAITKIYTLSLHDALPISPRRACHSLPDQWAPIGLLSGRSRSASAVIRQLVNHRGRSEEHTSELQSHLKLVCRLLLEKKNVKTKPRQMICAAHEGVQDECQ